MSLNYTPLRHRMLVVISENRVCRGYGSAGWWIKGLLPPSPYGRCESAVDAMLGDRLAEIPPDADRETPVALTDAGQLVLATWNGRHGEPQ